MIKKLFKIFILKLWKILIIYIKMTNNRAYSNNSKPIMPRGGKHHPSNLKGKNVWEDSLYAIGEKPSFQGFSGTTEFE